MTQASDVRTLTGKHSILNPPVVKEEMDKNWEENKRTAYFPPIPIMFHYHSEASLDKATIRLRQKDGNIYRCIFEMSGHEVQEVTVTASEAKAILNFDA